MKPQILVVIIVSLGVVAGAFWLVSRGQDAASATPVVATIVDGRQFVDITARGGYSPRVVMAKAGVPTTLRVTTNGTFDCSSSIVIPALSYQKYLPPSGTEEITISADQAKGILKGLCSMGMYNFEIRFE